jgi:hypothetical protein
MTQKRKILPVKLRARSYSNISRTVKDHTNDLMNDQNSFLIKPKKNMSLHLIQKNKSNEYDIN